MTLGHAAGYLLIAVLLILYLAVAVTLGTRFLPDHWALQLLFYGTAGIVWIFPVMKVLAYLHRRSSASKG